MPIYEHAALRPGQCLAGPVIAQVAASMLILLEGASAQADDSSSLIANFETASDLASFTKQAEVA